MKTRIVVLGIIAVVVAMAAVPAYALQAASNGDQLLSQEQLRTQEQLENCTMSGNQLQTKEQIRARDGSCGGCTGSCSTGGAQTGEQIRAQSCIAECLRLRTRISLQARNGS